MKILSFACITSDIVFIIVMCILDRCGHDRIVVGFITIYAITNVVSSNPVQASCTRNNIMRYSLSVTHGRSVFSPGTPVSYTNKTDCHDITEILLKVA